MSNKYYEQISLKLSKHLKLDLAIIFISILYVLFSTSIPDYKLIGEFTSPLIDKFSYFYILILVFTVILKIKTSYHLFKKISVWQKAQVFFTFSFLIFLMHAFSYLGINYVLKKYIIMEEVKNSAVTYMTFDIIDEYLYYDEDNVGVGVLKLKHNHTIETFNIPEDTYISYENKPRKEFQVDFKLRKGFSNYYVVEEYKLR